MASLDLKDAYYSLPIRTADRIFLRMRFIGRGEVDYLGTMGSELISVQNGGRVLTSACRVYVRGCTYAGRK